MKTKHGVVIAYGQTTINLSSDDLTLISDAMDTISPDSSESCSRATVLRDTFSTLAEYARSVEKRKQ